MFIFGSDGVYSLCDNLRDRGEVGGDALTLSLILTFCNWNHLVMLPKPDPWEKERLREAQAGLKQRGLWVKENGGGKKTEAKKGAVEAKRKSKSEEVWNLTPSTASAIMPLGSSAHFWQVHEKTPFCLNPPTHEKNPTQSSFQNSFIHLLLFDVSNKSQHVWFGFSSGIVLQLLKTLTVLLSLLTAILWVPDEQPSRKREWCRNKSPEREREKCLQSRAWLDLIYCQSSYLSCRL